MDMSEGATDQPEAAAYLLESGLLETLSSREGDRNRCVHLAGEAT